MMKKQNPEDKIFLQSIIQIVIKKNQKEQYLKNYENILVMYDALQHLITEYSENFNDCRKYHEAKAHLKYEHIISKLQKTIKLLRDKVQAQRIARGPTKTYVHDLLDKLVVYQHQKEILQHKNDELQKEIEKLNLKISKYEDGPAIKKQSSIVDEKKEENSTNQYSGEYFLTNNVSNFLKFKHDKRKQTFQSKSSFQRFLKKNLSFLSTWNFKDFLSSIDVWSQTILEIKKNQISIAEKFAPFENKKNTCISPINRAKSLLKPEMSGTEEKVFLEQSHRKMQSGFRELKKKKLGYRYKTIENYQLK